MQEKIIIKVPENLIFESTIEFIKTLTQLKEAKKYIFDFKNSRRIDPFSLLYLSSEIKFLRNRFIDSNFYLKDYKHLSYPAHMGFFKAFGAQYGNSPGQAKGNSSYIPIKIKKVYDIKDEAKEMMVYPGELIENNAKEMCKVLLQEDSGELFDTLVYSIREILRNIIEHSKSLKFGFCAQYLKSDGKVQLSILDRGIGIKKGLSDNPTLLIKDDEEALKTAILPGVSGKVYKGQKRKPKGPWANSGFGLYMTSNICRNGGSFFIASGDKGLYISENKYKIIDTPIQGTAVNLTIDTTKLTALKTVLSDLRDKAPSNAIASISSMGLSQE